MYCKLILTKLTYQAMHNPCFAKSNGRSSLWLQFPNSTRRLTLFFYCNVSWFWIGTMKKRFDNTEHCKYLIEKTIFLIFDESIKFYVGWHTWSRSISSCMSMHLKNNTSPKGTTNSNSRTRKWFPIVIRVTVVVLLLLPLSSFSSIKMNWMLNS